MAEIAPQLDILGYLDRASRTGFAAGAAMGANSLRYQQLQSEAAYRRLQEQQLAQAMALQMEQHDLAVQERADMTKAMARVQMQSARMLPAPADGPPEAGASQPTAFLPNPEYMPLDQALMQNVLPVVGKYRPQEVDNFVSNVAMLPYRQALAQKAQQAQVAKPFSPIGKLQADRDAAMQRGDQAAADEIDKVIEQQQSGRAGIEPEALRVIRAYEERTGKRLSDEEYKAIIDYKLGLRARPGVLHPVSRSDYISKHLNQAMDQPVIPDKRIEKGGVFRPDKEVEVHRKPKDRQEAVDYLGKEYDVLYGAEEAVAAPAPAAAATPSKVRRYNPATGKLE